MLWWNWRGCNCKTLLVGRNKGDCIIGDCRNPSPMILVIMVIHFFWQCDIMISWSHLLLSSDIYSFAYLILGLSWLGEPKFLATKTFCFCHFCTGLSRRGIDDWFWTKFCLIDKHWSTFQALFHMILVSIAKVMKL